MLKTFEEYWKVLFSLPVEEARPLVVGAKSSRRIVWKNLALQVFAFAIVISGTVKFAGPYVTPWFASPTVRVMGFGQSTDQIVFADGETQPLFHSHIADESLFMRGGLPGQCELAIEKPQGAKWLQILKVEVSIQGYAPFSSNSQLEVKTSGKTDDRIHKFRTQIGPSTSVVNAAYVGKDSELSLSGPLVIEGEGPTTIVVLFNADRAGTYTYSVLVEVYDGRQTTKLTAVEGQQVHILAPTRIADVPPLFRPIKWGEGIRPPGYQPHAAHESPDEID